MMKRKVCLCFVSGVVSVLGVLKSAVFFVLGDVLDSKMLNLATLGSYCDQRCAPSLQQGVVMNVHGVFFGWVLQVCT